MTVDIQLTADGTAVSGKTATLTKDHTSHKFDKLPKYKADMLITSMNLMMEAMEMEPERLKNDA